MDFMPGKRLDEAWENMNSSQKLSAVQEPHDYFPQLRSLKGDYIGAVDRGRAMIGQRDTLEGGPFDSEQLFNEFILSDIVRAAPDPLRHIAKHALQDGHGIVFTHGDLVGSPEHTSR